MSDDKETRITFSVDIKERHVAAAVNSRVEMMVYRALREAERNLEKKMDGKVWCETHGAVDPVLGCAVCQQDEPEGEKP